MRLSEWRALEQPLRVIEAANRLAVDEVKGLTITVVFANDRGNGVPVQMFIPFEDAGYKAIMDVVQPKLDGAKTEADTKVADFQTKAADALRQTP